MIDNILRKLEEEDFFVQHVSKHYNSTEDYGDLLSCEVTVDEERLKWAHQDYLQGVREFSIRLDSGDPDHYKRCGALLRALYKIKPIVSVAFDPLIEDFDTLSTPVGVSYSDAQYQISLGRFYDVYHNELTAFSFAYNVCCMYEHEPTTISDAYIHTMCAYLSSSDNLSADSLYMIFKSLML